MQQNHNKKKQESFSLIKEIKSRLFQKTARIGLVLSGGGVKGSYQLGIWKAMAEMGIAENVVAVSGTSVGALNGMLFTFGSYELAEKIWMEKVSAKQFLKSYKSPQHILKSFNLGISDADFDALPGVLVNSLVNNQLFSGIKSWQEHGSLFSNNGIRQILDDVWEDLNPHKKRPQLYVCAYQYIPKKAVYFQPRPKRKYSQEMLLASSAVPFAFPPVAIEDALYFDGGCIDNNPVTPLLDMDLDLIFVVNIEGYETPYRMQEKYPSKPIIEIKPFKNLGGLYRVMKFDQKSNNAYFDSGYKDGLAVFEQFHSYLSDSASLFEVANKTNGFISENREKYPAPGAFSMEASGQKLAEIYRILNPAKGGLPSIKEELELFLHSIK